MDAHQNDSDSSAGGGGGGGVLAAIKSTFKKGKRASVDGETEGSKHLDKGSVPLAKGSVPLGKGSMPLSPPSETDTDADDDSRRAGKVVPIIAPPGTWHGEATVPGVGRQPCRAWGGGGHTPYGPHLAPAVLPGSSACWCLHSYSDVWVLSALSGWSLGAGRATWVVTGC